MTDLTLKYNDLLIQYRNYNNEYESKKTQFLRLQENYINQKSSELFGDDSSNEKIEKLIYEETSNDDLSKKDIERDKIEMMKQYNSNDNIINYNIFNTIKVDNRSFNITSVGNQFVTNSFNNNDEVFLHTRKTILTRTLWISLILLLIAILIFIIIFVIN